MQYIFLFLFKNSCDYHCASKDCKRRVIDKAFGLVRSNESVLETIEN